MPGNKLLSGIIFFSYAVENKVTSYYYSIKLLAISIIKLQNAFKFRLRLREILQYPVFLDIFNSLLA